MTTDFRHATGAGDLEAAFREAMASFPSGVTIVTTTDAEGRRWGFTATSFCSLSTDPPLVLVCLATSAQCHPAFLSASSWVIQIVGPKHGELVRRFATRGADKFVGGRFGTSGRGHPVLTDACVVLECESYDRHDAGDHTILVGRVTDSVVRDTVPAVYFRRAFGALSP